MLLQVLQCVYGAFETFVSFNRWGESAVRESVNGSLKAVIVDYGKEGSHGKFLSP